MILSWQPLLKRDELDRAAEGASSTSTSYTLILNKVNSFLHSGLNVEIDICNAFEQLGSNIAIKPAVLRAVTHIRCVCYAKHEVVPGFKRDGLR